MGPTAEEIFNMFDVEKEETTFDEIIDLFNGYFTPKVNVIHERAVFINDPSLLEKILKRTFVRCMSLPNMLTFMIRSQQYGIG